jgi:hypothetical protein
MSLTVEINYIYVHVIEYVSEIFSSIKLVTKTLTQEQKWKYDFDLGNL